MNWPTNFTAGQKAKAATAYDSAVRYPMWFGVTRSAVVSHKQCGADVSSTSRAAEAAYLNG